MGLSQQVVISGQVIDYDTKEAIPFANIYVKNTTIGVMADLDGYYSISFDVSDGDTLSVNSMGYDDMHYRYTKGLDSITYDFEVPSSSMTLDEVVVLAGENPANEIIRNIIASKFTNDLAQWTETFSAELYSKTELDLVNIKPEMKDRPFFKDLQFIFDNIDSTTDVKPFLPAYLAERFYEIYHKKNNARKDILKAQKVSGVKNQTVVDFINSMNNEYNIYQNFITLLGKEFISPFSNQGLGFYRYYIMDSTMIKGKWSYKLKFKPKDRASNTFYGDFWVSMDDHALVLVNMRMNPEVNINLVNRILIYQEYDLNTVDQWVPFKQKTVIDFSTTKKEDKLGIIGRKTSSYKDIVINAPNHIETFTEIDLEDIDLSNIERPDTFWTQNRHENLSKNEKGVYKMIDSIQSVPIFKTYYEIIELLLTGYKDFGPLKVGPYSNLFTWNDVEGFRVSLGLGTSVNLSKRFQIYGFAGYGFGDRRWKYGGNMQYVINRQKRTAVGINFMHDATFEIRNSEERKSQSLFSGWLRRASIPQKMIYNTEGKIWYKHTWKKGFSNKLVFLHRRIEPVGYLNSRGGGLNFSYIDLPNTTTGIPDTLNRFRTSEIIFKTRFAFKEKIISGAFRDMTMGLGSKFPIVELALSFGIKGILGSQFNYQKIRLNYKHWFYTSPAGYIEYQFEVGKIFGNLPYLFLEVHPGNEAYFYNKTSFNSMNSFEFVSDFFVHARIEHHWEGYILNRIPFIRKFLRWRLVTALRASWGTLSADNLALNESNHYDRSIRSSKDRPQPFTEGPFYGPFDKGPFAEASIGIENIFQLIRVDALWRLNYLDNRDAQLFSVRVTLNFDF